MQQPALPPEKKPAMSPPTAASLQHTIVRTRDADATARLLSEVAGLRVGEQWHKFLPLSTANGVALDLLQVEDASPPIASQHYAFLTDDAGFDAGLQVLKSKKIDFWAHHTGAGKNKINTLYGGRGLYFQDAASGHNIELMTVVYGDPKEVDEVLEELKKAEEEEEEEKEDKAAKEERDEKPRREG